MKYIVANLILMSILRLSCAGQNSTQVKSYVIKSIDSTKNYYFITAICSTESRDSLLIISAKPSGAEKIEDRIMTKRAYKFILKSYLSKAFINKLPPSANGFTIKVDNKLVPIDAKHLPYKTDNLIGLYYKLPQ